jgi:hypothetical protein
MRRRRTRVRRRAAPRRSWPTRDRGRSTARHQPPRHRTYGSRRRPYRRGHSRLGVHLGRSLKTTLAAAAVVTVLAAVVVFLVGRGSMFHAIRRAPVAATSQASAADQLIYTARTANDAAIELPPEVQGELTKAGQAHQSVELVEVGYTGIASPSYVDMTPRTGNSPQDPVLKVGGRVTAAINAKVAGIQADVNSPAPGSGGRALFVGLTRTDFTSAPVTIISSGVDLSNPDNFRSLDWTVPPADVVAQVEKSGDMPSLHGPVTFVLVPTAGRQPQLAQAQKDYLEAVWTALLKAAGATSVTFIDAEGATDGPAAPDAPTVQLPSVPNTPIPLVRAKNGSVTCTLPDSFFIFNTADLVDAAKTEQDLAPCVQAALADHATFMLDGWTSYEGPLNAEGRPETNYPWNQQLSDERVTVIATLLVDDLGVPRSDITRMSGHGNLDQPDPGQPRSAANRVVTITYTTKATS